MKTNSNPLKIPDHFIKTDFTYQGFFFIIFFHGSLNCNIGDCLFHVTCTQEAVRMLLSVC